MEGRGGGMEGGGGGMEGGGGGMEGRGGGMEGRGGGTEGRRRGGGMGYRAEGAAEVGQGEGTVGRGEGDRGVGGGVQAEEPAPRPFAYGTNSTEGRRVLNAVRDVGKASLGAGCRQTKPEASERQANGKSVTCVGGGSCE